MEENNFRIFSGGVGKLTSQPTVHQAEENIMMIFTYQITTEYPG